MDSNGDSASLGHGRPHDRRFYDYGTLSLYTYKSTDSFLGVTLYHARKSPSHRHARSHPPARTSIARPSYIRCVALQSSRAALHCCVPSRGSQVTPQALSRAAHAAAAAAAGSFACRHDAARVDALARRATLPSVSGATRRRAAPAEAAVCAAFSRPVVVSGPWHARSTRAAIRLPGRNCATWQGSAREEVGAGGSMTAACADAKPRRCPLPRSCASMRKGEGGEQAPPRQSVCDQACTRNCGWIIALELVRWSELGSGMEL